MKDNEKKINDETIKNDELVEQTNEVNEGQEVNTDKKEEDIVEAPKTEAQIRAEIKKQMKEQAEKEEKEREKEREKRLKKYKRRKRILTVAAIILFLLLFMNRCSLPLPDSGNPTQVTIKEGDTINHDDIQFEIPEDFDSETNQIVCMNLTPVFETGTSQGLLYIDNDINNKYDQNIKIYLVKDGEVDESQCIYESGRIMPGQAIQYDTLDVDLPAGTYDCIASFYALVRVEDEETGASGAIIAGRTNLIVTVTVLG